MRRLFVVVAVAVLAAVFAPSAAHAQLPAPEPSPRVLRPCPTEDASGMRACVWDARHMGNGTGRSFLYLKAGDRIVFLTHAQAHSLLSWP